MKKLWLIILAVLLITTQVVAADYVPPLKMYKDNMILAGGKNEDKYSDRNNDQVKFQVSLMGSLWFESGVYFGYTQLTHWLVYDGRDTMFSQYQPEVFYRFESGNNLFDNYIIPYIDYFQVSPFYHCSTGVEGENHRSINEYYGQIQFSVGDVYNFGVNTKVFGYYSRAKENKDINDYKKYYEADVFFKVRSKDVTYLDKEELHIKFGGNPADKGFVACQLIFRFVTTYIQPRIMLEYYHGYDQFMTTYNVKETSYRAGFVF